MMRLTTRTYLLFSVLAALHCQGQSIVPVWENLITKPDPSIPIIKGDALPSLEADVFDGTSLADSLGAFKRYDESRLLLAVRENVGGGAGRADVYRTL